MSRYIDADKLKEVFDGHEDDYGYLHGDWEEFIDNAPTADVRENIKGEWIKPISRGDVLSYGKAYYECDQCHKVAFFGNEMNFCPNCGAQMGGDNNV